MCRQNLPLITVVVYLQISDSKTTDLAVTYYWQVDWTTSSISCDPALDKLHHDHTTHSLTSCFYSRTDARVKNAQIFLVVCARLPTSLVYGAVTRRSHQARIADAASKCSNSRLTFYDQPFIHFCIEPQCPVAFI